LRDKGEWKHVNALPIRYRNIDLRHGKYVRTKDYRDDSIRRYHPRSSYVKGRCTATNTNRNRQNKTKGECYDSVGEITYFIASQSAIASSGFKLLDHFQNIVNM
jgi:hypothetical protein